jgi:hypothetical protein
MVWTTTRECVSEVLDTLNSQTGRDLTLPD